MLKCKVLLPELNSLGIALAVAMVVVTSCSKDIEKQSQAVTNKTANEEVTSGVEPIKIIAKGTNYDIAGNMVKGYVTIFDFYADW